MADDIKDQDDDDNDVVERRELDRDEESIDQNILKQFLIYESETGIFFWKKCGLRQQKFVGKPAGSVNYYGYIQISLKGKKYKAHRLAWLYVFGYFPKEIDHINLVKTDNRISNLREATRSQNNINGPVRKNSTGLKGVRKIGNKYTASVGYKGKQVYLGIFDKKEDAASIYEKTARSLYGNFVRV